MKRIYAVIDCNNFFVSCERVFRPELENRPVIILSNNDGCAVSRSNEAKPLIAMGAPLFKHRAELERAGGVWLSANFQLCGDMSRRVMSILDNACPEVEPYSVDEAFLQIGNLGIDDYTQWSRDLRQRILDWTGLPVSVGIAPTKTLAKAAVERAKKDETSANVLDFTDESIRAKQLQQLPLDDIWGVGRRLAPKLRAYGLRTAADVRDVDSKWLAQLYNIHGQRLVDELNGVDCYGAEVTFNQPPKRNITASRSFGQQLRAINQLEPAVANFIARAAAKARRHQRLATTLSLYLVAGTNAQRKTLQVSCKLDEPTSDTGLLITQVQQLLTQAHQQGLHYKKAGINLGGLVPEMAAQQQLDSELDDERYSQRQQLMRTIDGLNQRWGKGAADFAVQHTSEDWRSRRRLKSQAYTTSWAQIQKLT